MLQSAMADSPPLPYPDGATEIQADDSFGLAWSIGLALREVALYDARRRKLTLEDKTQLGRVIEAQLRLSRMRFLRLPPLPGHGIP